MTLQEERIIFRTLADPITAYFKENGIDELQAGIMAGALAQRQIHNITDMIDKRDKNLLDLISDLSDDEDCEYDHHGYCQTHVWFETEPSCAHKRAQELLKKEKQNGGKTTRQG